MTISRRDFAGALGGSAAWPLMRPSAACAQQGEQMRRIGVLMSLAAGDKESELRLAAFVRALQDLGWTQGRNLGIEVRWGDDNAETTRRHVAELVALAPDVILASGSTAATPLKQATGTVPIVFVQVAEPAGLVESFARPGGNVTGFASIGDGATARWVELLKEVAPGTTRAVVVRDAGSNAGKGQFAAIETAAKARGIAISAAGVRDAAEIERAIAALAREGGGGGGGLIVTTSTRASAHRALMLALTARHRLPAVYPFRFYVADGGLMSYGTDWIDQYRRAAAAVDRILKGEKPADIPVETPQKYDLVINRRTANALGLMLPPQLIARADEVIE